MNLLLSLSLVIFLLLRNGRSTRRHFAKYFKEEPVCFILHLYKYVRTDRTLLGMFHPIAPSLPARLETFQMVYPITKFVLFVPVNRKLLDGTIQFLVAINA